MLQTTSKEGVWSLVILKRYEDEVLMISCRSLIVKVWERLRLLLLLDSISFLTEFNCRCISFIFHVLTKPEKIANHNGKTLRRRKADILPMQSGRFSFDPKKRNENGKKKASVTGRTTAAKRYTMGITHFQTGNHNWLLRF